MTLHKHSPAFIGKIPRLLVYDVRTVHVPYVTSTPQRVRDSFKIFAFSHGKDKIREIPTVRRKVPTPYDT
jgi:hypothetical protein